MRGWRWDAGQLIEVPEAQGRDVLRLVETLPFNPRLPPLPERLRDPKIHTPGLLRASALPGAPPTWFRPNAARRVRVFLWHTTPKATRRALAPWDSIDLKSTTLQGHHIEWDSGRGAPAVAMIYLPDGQEATQDDVDAVAYAMGWSEHWPKWLREEFEREQERKWAEVRQPW